MGKWLLCISLCMAVVLFVAMFWIVSGGLSEERTKLRAGLRRTARWSVFLVSALILAWCAAIVREAAVLDREDLLQDKPDDYLLLHVWGLGVLAGLA